MSENTKPATINILIVFYTRYGNTARMADEISQGAKEIADINIAIKRIAEITSKLVQNDRDKVGIKVS